MDIFTRNVLFQPSLSNTAGGIWPAASTRGQGWVRAWRGDGQEMTSALRDVL